MKPNSGLKPVNKFRVHKRNLPHWESPGNAYFITFSTAANYELTDGDKNITLSAIKYHSDKKYKLYACVVMKTHVHIILQPLEESPGNYFSLSRIMHSIKSYAANRIQRTSKQEGSIWLGENYDRIIRDEDDLSDILDYIIYNPVKAGIVDKPESYKWLYFEGLS